MDFIDKGVAWARNICATFEAMCLEVDDIMYKVFVFSFTHVLVLRSLHFIDIFLKNY